MAEQTSARHDPRLQDGMRGEEGGGIPRSEDEKPWKQSQAGPSLPNVVFYCCFSVIPPYCTSNYPTMGETWPSSLSEEQGPDGAMAFNINISSNCSLTPLKYTDKEGICLSGWRIRRFCESLRESLAENRCLVLSSSLSGAHSSPSLPEGLSVFQSSKN